MVLEQDQKARLWAKQHKKEFARRLIREFGAEKSSQPAAIFMAGLPGAGKTEFTKSWIANSELKVVRLDMDEIAAQIETYAPQKADRFREAATMLLNRTYDMVVNGGYDFIMDGTFGSRTALKDITRVIKHGYRIKIIYIFQDPKVAWEYTVARERVEHRAIELEGFLKAYYNTLENLRAIEERNFEGFSVDLVVKDKQNKVSKTYENISMLHIDDYVNIEYNKDKLRELICE